METKIEMSNLLKEQFAIKGSFNYYDAEKWLRKNNYRIEIVTGKNYKTEKEKYSFEANYKKDGERNYDLDYSFGDYANFGIAIENTENAIFNICIACKEVLQNNNIEINHE